MVRIGLALASAALLLAACGSGGSTGQPGALSTSTPPAAGPTSAAVAKDDACTLLVEADLQTVFTAAIPTPKGRNLGLGFADCLWEDDALAACRRCRWPTSGRTMWTSSTSARA